MNHLVVSMFNNIAAQGDGVGDYVGITSFSRTQE
ncbi:hypothetical protein CFT9_27146 [Pseudomonas sp. CFT9]|nr:hypothetical protein CFT9_27146 [Pseudomonas sp. CFT9]